MDKKAQIWGMDLMVGVIIFSIALTSFYFYTVNEVGGTEEKLGAIAFEARSITNTLLSSGYPEDWNSSNVIELGILSDGKINQTKLERFYDFASSDYSGTKRTFNTIYDYYFFMNENMTIYSNPVEGIGKAGTTRDNVNAKNLIKVNRIVVYNNKPVEAHLYLWEE